LVDNISGATKKPKNGKGYWELGKVLLFLEQWHAMLSTF